MTGTGFFKMFSRLFGGFGAQAQPADERVRVVDPATIRGWLDAGEVVLVDVREANEFASENIPGAINLPLSSFNPALVPKPEVGKRLVIHCRSGVRCGSAAGLLLAAGWEGEINRMQGGIMGWASMGGPLRRGS